MISQHECNSICTGIIPVRYTLLPVFYSSSRWSQRRLRPGAVPDSRTLHSLPPSSIYPLHLAACQTALCHRPSLQTLTIFVFLFSFFSRSMCICLPFPSLTPVSSVYLLFSFCVAPLLPPCSHLWEAFKNRNCWKARSEGPTLKGTAQVTWEEITDGGKKRGFDWRTALEWDRYVGKETPVWLFTFWIHF